MLDAAYTAPAGGLAVAIVTEACKRIPWVPIDPDNTAAVRALAAVLSLLAGVASAYVAGPEAFQRYDWATAINVTTGALIAYVTATAAHVHAPKPQPP